MPANHPIINNSAHSSMSTAVDSDLLSIILNVSPVFLTLIVLSFLFIAYKSINKFFMTEALTETQLKKELNYQTIAYAVFMSAMAGFMADMYLSLPVSIFIACCSLYVIYLFIRFLTPKT
ncbi:hypothetical protein SHI21_00815 [Bacteriovorax sp. PP10]|uniref:Uncharacterized protein n=1 Tax=Bacteriovorax antarcticus TaxID=3088717 RepID=A0ABU5VRS3_9BACT|nr:hypothetical protein [Bacteriovorax sp. PP10]MEA9354725.1 hypothetical protein [Bacteriovorax sp. PP10]